MTFPKRMDEAELDAPKRRHGASPVPHYRGAGEDGHRFPFHGVMGDYGWSMDFDTSQDIVASVLDH